MRITYGDAADYAVEEGTVEELNALDIPEGKCLFRLFVNKPSDAKIEINDIEQDSVLVDEMEVVHWRITRDGYRPSIGEFQVINSIGFSLSLVPQKPKRIKQPYIKWSINDKYGYKVEVLDLSDQEESDAPVPSPEGKDNCYLYAFGGNMFWKEIKLENLLQLHSFDSGKYLTYDSKFGFSFKSPVPELPDDNKVYVLKVSDGEMSWVEDESIPEFPIEELGNKNFYMLTYKDGKMKWTLNPFTLPKLPDESYYQGEKFVLSCKNGEVSWKDGDAYWGHIKGEIVDQPDIKLLLDEQDERVDTAIQRSEEKGEEAVDIATTAGYKADNALDWIEQFGVEADGFEFVDGKIKYEDGFVFPDGRDIANLHNEFNTFKGRYSTFEKYVIAQVQMRLTSPDYSQLSDVEYRFDNYFFNSKKRYLHIESLDLGSTIDVYRPLIDETSGSITGPDVDNGPIMTIYRNVSGEGDIRLIELTTGFFYKVSSKEAFNLKYVGELPYGEYPG